MENKQNKRELQRELLLKLRDAVNSQEEFEWVEAELARLDSLKLAARDEWGAEEGCLDWQCIEYYLDAIAEAASETVIKPRPPEVGDAIDTASEAVAWLQETGDCIVAQCEIQPRRWIVSARNTDFEETFTDTEILEFAREQQGVLSKLLKNPTQLGLAEFGRADGAPRAGGAA